MEGSGSESVQIITNPDGPKTYGSYKSETLMERMADIRNLTYRQGTFETDGGRYEQSEDEQQLGTVGRGQQLEDSNC
jgi:hypothetical protein